MHLINITSIFLFLCITPLLAINSSSAASTALTTDQIIIKYKDNRSLNQTNMPNFTQGIPTIDGSSISMFMQRQNSFHANIVKVNVNGKRPTLEEMKALAKELNKRTDIEYAEPDYIMHAMAVPNDSLYASEHWHYKSGAGAANLEGAWDITTGSTSDVIAVIDTGYVDHTDLSGKILPGYDMISYSTVGNDGDGRDSDAHDPGDATLSSGGTSSWHGTHVAGTIAANSNNSYGVTGINWSGKILPVRVLGVGGGYSSDIADGILWAAGLAVSGVPTNPNPAKVLNMSLGGAYSCSGTITQTAIDAAVSAGSVVVVAAGNDNADASGYTPAGCNNVITVAATQEGGARASYSNYGSVVEIAAPGSNVHSTLDGGATSPLNDNSYASYNGTSMATPHVAGIASLITSAGILPNATPAEVLNILQQTVSAFSTGTGNDCTTLKCGAGLIDATAALTLATGGTPPPPPLETTYTILDISGEWTTSAYSKYYTFTLTKSADVTIDLVSAVDTYMYLRDNSGNIITYDDDGGDGLNSRILRTLNPGTYIIEATTYSGSTIGLFTLKAIGYGEAQNTTIAPIINYLLD